MRHHVHQPSSTQMLTGWVNLIFVWIVNIFNSNEKWITLIPHTLKNKRYTVLLHFNALFCSDL